MTDTDLAQLRSAIDGGRKRLCAALNLRPDGNRYFCPRCQSDGAQHADGDFSIEAGFRCHKCGLSADGFGLVQEVKHCDFPAALAFVREVFGVADGMPAKAVHKAADALPAWPTAEAAAEGFLRFNKRLAGATVERIFTCHEPDGKTPRGAEVRYMTPEGKQCRPFKFVAGAWHSGAPEKWTVYGRRELPPAGPVYVPEGPKCRDFMARLGFNSIASFGGASGAKKTEWEPLAGREVIIMPDADEPGERYAATVAEILHGMNCEIRIVRLPDMPEGGDVADLPGTPETAELVQRLAEDAEPWTPPAPVEARAVEPPMPEVEGKAGNPIELAKRGAPYPMTDLGNAERLVAWHGDSIRWDIPRSCWRIWDGRRWKADNELKVLELAAKSARLIRREASECPAKKQGEADLSADLWKHALRSESRDKLAACVAVAKSLPGVAVDADSWDSDSWLLNVKNGTVDLRSGALKAHDRNDMMTRLASVDYDPAARCERWERFLSDSAGGDREFLDFLQRAAGYTLSGLTVEEICFFVYGATASGKTTFLETLKAVLGEYAATIDPGMLCKSKFGGGGSGNATPELARLDGVRLAGGSEIEQGRELAEATLKSIVGGETITARHLYSGIFQYVPRFKLWLAMNHCPRASADDPAIWRRVLRVNFDKTVPVEKRDKTLKPYLAHDGAPAVLAWAVAGCLSWQKEGLGVPACVRASTEAYRAESDPLANFIEDCISFEPFSWLGNSELQEAYSTYCDDNGIKFQVSPRRLADRLKSLGAVPGKRAGYRGWDGVSLSPDDWQNPKKGTPVEAEKKRAVDGLDGLDGTSKTFLHEGFSRKSLNQSVQSVQSVQTSQKPPIFGTFQNGKIGLAAAMTRRDTPEKSVEAVPVEAIESISPCPVEAPAFEDYPEPPDDDENAELYP